jgi:hypothetical protein
MPVPRVSPVWIVPSEAVKKSPGQGIWPPGMLRVMPGNRPLLAARLRRDTEGMLIDHTDLKAL